MGNTTMNAIGHEIQMSAMRFLVINLLLWSPLLVSQVDSQFPDTSLPPSPCPSVFSYEGREAEHDRWYGVVLVTTNQPLTGLRLDVRLSRAARLLGNWDGEVTTQDNVRFTVLNLDKHILPGPPTSVRIFVVFDGGREVPYLQSIALNGRQICPSEQANSAIVAQPPTWRPAAPTRYTTPFVLDADYQTLSTRRPGYQEYETYDRRTTTTERYHSNNNNNEFQDSVTKRSTSDPYGNAQNPTTHRTTTEYANYNSFNNGFQTAGTRPQPDSIYSNNNNNNNPTREPQTESVYQNNNEFHNPPREPQPDNLYSNNNNNNNNGFLKPTTRRPTTSTDDFNVVDMSGRPTSNTHIENSNRFGNNDNRNPGNSGNRNPGNNGNSNNSANNGNKNPENSNNSGNSGNRNPGNSGNSGNRNPENSGNNNNSGNSGNRNPGSSGNDNNSGNRKPVSSGNSNNSGNRNPGSSGNSNNSGNRNPGSSGNSNNSGNRNPDNSGNSNNSGNRNPDNSGNSNNSGNRNPGSSGNSNNSGNRNPGSSGNSNNSGNRNPDNSGNSNNSGNRYPDSSDSGNSGTSDNTNPVSSGNRNPGNTGSGNKPISSNKNKSTTTTRRSTALAPDQEAEWITTAPTTRRTTSRTTRRPASTSRRPPTEVEDLTSGECGRVHLSATPLITHGQTTSRGQWPWHVAVYQTKGKDLTYICGGSLVSSLVVVTAAHCVAKIRDQPVDPDTLVIYLGKYHLKLWSEGGVQDKQVKKVLIHPSYNSSDFRSDVALLVLSSPAELTQYVRPVCLWGDRDVDVRDMEDREGYVVGWGYDERGQTTEELMMAKMPIVSQQTCIWSYPEFFSHFTSNKTYCAGFKNGTSVCNGDSGGGMVFPQRQSDGSKVWHLRGLVSISVSKEDQRVCDTKHYVVFTDLAKHQDWINNNIK